MNESIVGIDLGTTNSSVAVWRNGQVEIVEVDGEQMMPSCVGIDNSGELFAGIKARNQVISDPDKTVFSVKRLMGTERHVHLSGKQYSPEEISACILSTLKHAAGARLGTEPAKAIITVPAYFNDFQRKATKQAGELAGLEVMRIINEPTAASLAYEAGHEENRNILVYDLGGGTFDASIVVVENGVVEVKASHGDTRLGGDDFDRLLCDYVAEEFKKVYGVDLRDDPVSGNRLLFAAERAKRELSDHPYTMLREEYIYSEEHLNIELSRDAYEEMIRPLLKKTMECVHACLTDAAFLPKAIDRIILVGGSTRTPLVHRMLMEDMGIEPRYEINPDLIVAMGAAMQAGAIGGVETCSILVDITPYTFGTRAVSIDGGMPDFDRFVPVIKRNTPLPAEKEEVFCTMVDNQTEVLVEIYQGEAENVNENTFIGKFMIQGLSEVPEGNPVLLNLALDMNGILQVTAKEKVTGLTKSVAMDTTADACYDSAEDSPGQKTDLSADNSDSVSPGVRTAKQLRARAEKLLPDMNEEDAAEVRDLLEQSRRAVADGDMDTLAELNDSLSDMLFYLEE